LRVLCNCSDTEAWVFGEFENGAKPGQSDALTGRVVHWNREFHTLYVGHMLKGQRHGWGLEIPLRNVLYRKAYSGQWEKDTRLDTPEGEAARNTLKKDKLNTLAYEILDRYGLLQKQLVTFYFTSTLNLNAEGSLQKVDTFDWDRTWSRVFVDDKQVREIRAEADVAVELGTLLGSGYSKIRYAGEWNDVVTNKAPALDGRGIRITQKDAEVRLHFGSFK